MNCARRPLDFDTCRAENIIQRTRFQLNNLSHIAARLIPPHPL
jgi:hypothetical protein